MKILISENDNFTLSTHIINKLHIPININDMSLRKNADLIELIEQNPQLAKDIKIVEIPNSTTDWEILVKNNREFIVYVIDGKIHHKY